MRTEEKSMNLPIRESTSPDELTTSYSNGYKRISISERARIMARDPDMVMGHVMKHLRPDYTKELLSDTPYLNLSTFTEPNLSLLGTEEDKDTVIDSIKLHSFRPKGKLYNGLHVYDREEIERETKEKHWDPIIWGNGDKYNAIMGDMNRRMQQDIEREMLLPAKYFGNQISNFSDAANAAQISTKDLSYKFQVFRDEAWGSIRDFYKTRLYDDPQTVPRPRWRNPLRVVNGPEERARVLLHRMIGAAAFRGYLRNGFVTYQGRSRRIYQVFPGYGMCNVWKNGEPVEKLCLVFQDGQLPPTDSVIMRLFMLEYDEAEFCRLAIKHPFNPPRARYTDPVVETGRIVRMVERKREQRILVA